MALRPNHLDRWLSRGRSGNVQGKSGEMSGGYNKSSMFTFCTSSEVQSVSLRSMRPDRSSGPQPENDLLSKYPRVCHKR